jgi:uncharacterized membrane protein
VIGKVSTIVFAVVLIGWGILGLVKGDFAPGWQPVPESMPLRQALAYLTAVVCIAVGVGLLVKRASAVAARAFFFWLIAWLLLLRLPWMFVDFGVGTWWSASSTAVITATAWVVYISLSDDRQQLGFLTNNNGLRMARILCGLGLIPIGLAHFLYVEATAPLVPTWLQWPVFWAYFTGAAFVAAGLAMIIDRFARLAAVLVTLQIGLFTLLIWVPRAIEGSLTPFQWGEFVVSIILTVCGWVVTESYRGTTWFRAGEGYQQELR